MGTVDKQLPQVTISLLGDPALRISFSGLLASRTQPEKRSYLPTFSKPMGSFQGQNIRQSCQRTYSGDLSQGSGLGVLLFTPLEDDSIVFTDLFRQLRDQIQKRRHRLFQLLRYMKTYLVRKTGGG